MSQTSPMPNQKLVTELKVSAHLMLLDPGLFCVFHSPGTAAPDPATGLPGVRISRAPSTPAESLSISSFNPDGWLGGEGSAALVQVSGQPAQVLVTIYQAMNGAIEAPKLQVLRLGEAARPAAAAQVSRPPAPAGQPAVLETKPEVAAHVQRRGDLLTRLGEWMGERGSQSWIEGFAISPARHVAPADIEYQAVLGKGWLSPWSEGGSYCGSRGMALPILGLRVRLKGEAAEQYDVRVSATFTDGSSAGPVDGTQTVESAELAPLEAFMVEVMPRHDAATDAALPGPATEAMPAAPPPATQRKRSRLPRAELPASEPAPDKTPARPGLRGGGSSGTRAGAKKRR